MGRRSSKAGQEVVAAAELDSVGVTILPGHPLPAWAGGEDPAASSQQAVAGAWQSPAWGTDGAWAGQEPVSALDPAAAELAGELAGAGLAGELAATQAAGVDAAWAAATTDPTFAAQPEPAFAAAAQPEPAWAGAVAPAWAGATQAAPAWGGAAPGWGAAEPGPGSAPPPGTGLPAGIAGGVAAGVAPGAGAWGSGPSSSSAYPTAPSAGFPAAPATAGTPPGAFSTAPAGSGPVPAGFSSAPAGLGAAPSGVPGTPAGASAAVTATTGPGGIMAAAQAAPSLPAPREAQAPMMASTGTMATSWPQAPTAPSGTGLPETALSGGATTSAATATAAPPSAPGAPSQAAVAPDASPSDVWTSQQRPELTPEHVALLTWWAEMISKGQFPGPVPAAAAPPVAGRSRRRGRAAHKAPEQAKAPVAAPTTLGDDDPRSSRGRRLLIGVAAAVCGVALVGAAVVVGPTLLGSGPSQPAPVPVTDLVMPAGVGDLVPLDAATAAESLPPVVGLGLRPKGVTVTQAYGTAPQGPMVLAALASTAPTRSDAVGQILSWEQANGAKVGESVAGTGAAAGITCAPVSALPSGPTGSICVYGDQVLRGQTYAVGADPQAAIQLTAQLRSGVTPATQP